ncbi:PH domain-containing protein [Aurantiacibacter arachoides]|uniref:PH domain-containing protein n=1 Tax=Aurantiacibacter arachoides TaxID=1850444 RepID=UPI00136BD696|nr:PH domain-containing protein [Aurantiacibacter arachoides]
MNEAFGAKAAGDVAPGEWRRVNPLSIFARTARGLVSGLVPAAFVLFGAARSENFSAAWIVFPILLAIFGAQIGAAWLAWSRTRYRIGENDVRLEQGILSRSARSIPYDRIQDVSLEQRLLPRLLGLVEVKFETGAGGKEELALAYVSEAEGERLRETVRALVDGADTFVEAPAGSAAGPLAGAGEVPVAAADPRTRTLFAMQPRRLLVYGLFSFSLVIFAVILGAAQQFDFLFNVWDWLDVFIEDERYRGAADALAGYSTSAKIAAALYALVTIIVVGMASGVAQVFVRDWGFLLERTAKGFRRRRGLLTKTDVVMPVHRVQALVVSTGWLRRRFGWHGLAFISLAQDSGKANHEVAPFATMDEIAPIVAEAGFTLPGAAVRWWRPAPAYYAIRAGLAVLLVAVALTVAVVVAAAEGTPLWPLLLLIVPVAAWQALRGWYLWRVERHALDRAQVLSKRGWLSPNLQIASRAKLHSAGITQGPFGRWLGYCTLNLGLAGGTMAFRGLRREDARSLRAAVLDSMIATDFSQLPR